MMAFQLILMGFLIVCAVSVSFSKKLLNSILIYMSFSLVMSILWVCLKSPDLAITEAAVGAGVTSILFFATLKRIHALVQEEELHKEEEAGGEKGKLRMEEEAGEEKEELHMVEEKEKAKEELRMEKEKEKEKAKEELCMVKEKVKEEQLHEQVKTAKGI